MIRPRSLNCVPRAGPGLFLCLWMTAAVFGCVGENGERVSPSRSAAIPALSPESDELFKRGVQLLADGQETEAADALEKAYSLSPDSARVVVALSRAYRNDKNFSAAQDRLEDFLDSFPPTTPGGERAGRALVEVFLDQGELSQAGETLLPLMELEPVAAATLTLAGRLAYLEGDLESAGAHLDRAVAAGPDEADAHSWRGKVLLQQGGLEEASRSLLRALEIDPDSQDALHNLAKVYERRGMNEEANETRERFQEVLERKSARQRLAPVRARGVEDYNTGRFDKALESFRTILEVAPRDPQALAHAGSALLALGRLPQAEKLLDRAVEVQPSNDFAWTELGRLHAVRNNLPRAIEMLTRATDANPSAPQPHYFLAGIYYAQGRAADYRREKAAYERLSEGSPPGSLMALPEAPSR